AEVERLHVDDYLVAHLGAPDERNVGDRRANSALHFRAVDRRSPAPALPAAVAQFDQEILLEARSPIIGARAWTEPPAPSARRSHPRCMPVDRGARDPRVVGVEHYCTAELQHRCWKLARRVR